MTIIFILSFILVGVVFLMDETSEEKIIRELKSYGVDIKHTICGKIHKVEISKSLKGLQFQHASFSGDSLLKLLEEALRYIEKYIEEWFNHGGYC